MTLRQGSSMLDARAKKMQLPPPMSDPLFENAD